MKHSGQSGFPKRPPRNRLCRVASGASRGEAPEALRGGFTLIEVMVALAIVAIALAAGMRAAGAVVSTSQRFDDVVLAQWCVDNELVDLRVTDTLPAVGTSSFACSQMGRGFRGTLKVQATPNPAFRRVDASVSNEGDERTLVTISTVMSH